MPALAARAFPPLLVASLAFVMLAGSPRLVAAQGPAPEVVRAMLSGYESVPSLAEWRRLGPETLRVLVALYEAPDTAPYVRLRAVAATAAFPTTATRTFLLRVASGASSDLIAREAVLTLGRAFGDGARGELAPFLSHRLPLIREAAARALGRIGTPGCRALLEVRLETEGHPAVRAAVTRALDAG
ncbi:MAG: HEAT repeat domain-containing protein [Myxococcota bacterium]